MNFSSTPKSYFLKNWEQTTLLKSSLVSSLTFHKWLPIKYKAQYKLKYFTIHNILYTNFLDSTFEWHVFFLF